MFRTRTLSLDQVKEMLEKTKKDWKDKVVVDHTNFYVYGGSTVSQQDRIKDILRDPPMKKGLLFSQPTKKKADKSKRRGSSDMSSLANRGSYMTEFACTRVYNNFFLSTSHECIYVVSVECMRVYACMCYDVRMHGSIDVI